MKNRLFKKFLFLIFYFSLPLLAAPNWYYKQDKKHENELIAFGADKSLQIARQLAKTELAKSIKINISSNTNIKKTFQNDTLKKDIKSFIKTSTNIDLNGLKIEKEEFYNNIWYVKVSYDNRSLLEKIQALKSYFKNYKVATNSNIDFYENINKLLGFNVKTKLFRKNSSWYLKIANKTFLLNNSDFSNFFKNRNNKNIEFKLNKKTYKYPEEMTFTLKSKTKGFVSILYSQENGKVGILLNNENISNKLQYPKEDSQDSLIVYNDSKYTLKEQYIAIYSKNKLDLSNFEDVDENKLDESTYNYDKLLNLLEKNIYSSKQIKIKPNN